METKICTRCGEEKKVIEFRKGELSCKKCISEHRRIQRHYYYLDNKIKIAEKSKEYRSENKDKIQESKAIYRKNNKLKIKEHDKIYRDKLKLEHPEILKEYSRKYVKSNPLKVRISSDRWESKNPEKMSIYSEKAKIYKKYISQNLKNQYVTQMIKRGYELKTSEITPKMIELKRISLLNQRIIKNKTYETI